MQPLHPPQDSTDKPGKGLLQQPSGHSRGIRTLSVRVESRGSQFSEGYGGNKGKTLALMQL